MAFSVACGLFLVGAVITAALLRSGRLPSEDHAGERDTAASTDDDDTVDIAALRRRITELEAENRCLQEVLHIRTVAASTAR